MISIILLIVICLPEMTDVPLVNCYHPMYYGGKSIRSPIFMRERIISRAFLRYIPDRYTG